MSRVGLVLASATAFAVSLLGQDQDYSKACLRQPIRMFDSVRVDLKPLCNWWSMALTNRSVITNEEYPRPLSAWVRVTGRKVKDMGVGWMVEAEIQNVPFTYPGKTTIFIKHPPQSEESKFNALVATSRHASAIADAESRRMAVVGEQRRAKSAHYDQVAKVAAANAELAAPFSREQAYYNSQANAYSNAAASTWISPGAQSRAGAQASDIDRTAWAEINKLPHTAGNNAEYVIDFFALSTRETYRRMPVYDLGRMP